MSTHQELAAVDSRLVTNPDEIMQFARKLMADPVLDHHYNPVFEVPTGIVPYQLQEGLALEATLYPGWKDRSHVECVGLGVTSSESGAYVRTPVTNLERLCASNDPFLSIIIVYFRDQYPN